MRSTLCILLYPLQVYLVFLRPLAPLRDSPRFYQFLSPTAVGLRRLSQPARRAPSCSGLTSRGGIGMRVPTAAGLRRLSQPARKAPSCSGLTSRGGTGMRVPTAAGVRRFSQPVRKAPSCIRLTSRGGIGMRVPTAAGLRRLSQTNRTPGSFNGKLPNTTYKLIRKTRPNKACSDSTFVQLQHTIYPHDPA